MPDQTESQRPTIRLSTRATMRAYAMRVVARSIPASSRNDRPEAALICPSAPPGSIGDAAMIIALRDKLRATGCGHVGVVEYPRGRRWTEELQFDSAPLMPESAIGRWREFGHALVRYRRFYVIGADCIDGYYSPSLSRRLLEVGAFAAHCGCASTICGSSFNLRPSPEVVATVRTLPDALRLLARDPLSQVRMAGLSGRRTELVADLAFMLQPTPAAITATAAWAASMRGAGRRILGVNIANAFLGAARKEETPLLVKRFADAIGQILQERPDCSVLLVPHDTRGERSDRALCEEAFRQLGSSHGDRLRLFADSYSPQALKAAAALLDACITCRMHFGIACLGSGTPLGVIPYQDKFEGLFEHFEIRPPLLMPDNFFHNGALESLFRETLAAAPTQSVQIAARREHVLRLSVQNLG